MPFKQVFEKKEDAPEWAHGSLVEQDGKFVFEGETAAEVGVLKSTLKKERDGRTRHEADLKRYERFTPLLEADDEEFGQFLEGWQKRGERQDDDPKKKADPDAAKQLEMKDKLHAKEIKKRDDELATLKTDAEKIRLELRDFKLWTPLREVAIKAGLNPDDWELARLDLANQGRFGFDDDGKIVVMEDGSASTVTPEKFFKDVYSDQRPKFYKASTAGGGGATNNKTTNGGKKTISRAAFNDMGPGERAAYVREGGQVTD